MFLSSQTSWAVIQFPASLEQKRNTVCENWNVVYITSTWFILHRTVKYAITSKLNQYRNNNFHYLLQKLGNYQKTSVPQTAQISKLERIFSKSPRQIEIGGEHLFWGIARLFVLSTKYFQCRNLITIHWTALLTCSNRVVVITVVSTFHIPIHFVVICEQFNAWWYSVL